MNDHERAIKVCALTAQIKVDDDFPRLKQYEPSPEQPALGKRLHHEQSLVSTCDLDETKTQDYLDLCKFVMRDASPDCNGILLRGSSLLEEKSLHLLRSYDFNYELATFHILNAEQMAIPVLEQKYLALFTEEPAVLTRVIQD